MENLSKEKQIEEMARDLEICDREQVSFCHNKKCKECEFFYNKEDCYMLRVSQMLVGKGYRKQEWISVEERLPEKYGAVLCYTRNGTIWQVIYNPQYKLFNVSSDNTEDALAVDYWMPLPEPPKMKGGAE